jgi:O-antigen ligase
VLLAGPALHFVRVIDLIHLGDAASLSNRNLIWPYFEAALARSPWLGWGVGAGKVIVPLHSPIGRFLGTNAAHDEYLRIACEGGVPGALLLFGLLGLWLFRGSAALPVGQRRLIRLVFLAFAVQSLTDNTLIATTSLTFFTWARAVFINPDEGSAPA